MPSEPHIVRLCYGCPRTLAQDPGPGPRLSLSPCARQHFHPAEGPLGVQPLLPKPQLPAGKEIGHLGRVDRKGRHLDLHSRCAPWGLGPGSDGHVITRNTETPLTFPVPPPQLLPGCPTERTVPTLGSRWRASKKHRPWCQHGHHQQQPPPPPPPPRCLHQGHQGRALGMFSSRTVAADLWPGCRSSQPSPGAVAPGPWRGQVGAHGSFRGSLGPGDPAEEGRSVPQRLPLSSPCY